jgi:HAD superfamily hydrolase (TIGR01549 family)
MSVDAITFDFYNTLVYPVSGRGRGAMLMDYLDAQGLESDPWEHHVLYDVFESHGHEYSPRFSTEEKHRYYGRFAARVFERLSVRVTGGDAALHAENVWNLIGPAGFAVFSEVPSLLRTLRAAGYRLGVVSNWQCGLSHFCVELGLGNAFDEVLASAEIGSAKPDPAIFYEACRRLGTPCDRVLHVGDSVLDDLEGARNAGLQAVLLQRDPPSTPPEVPTIRSLHAIPQVLAQASAPPRS